jgi:hypothetical protein
MSRRLFFLPLVAALPAFLCAQQPKLVNCRTLEAAGNFVGPDEVIVDDLVCQKAKPGAQTNFAPQVPKAVPGVVISGDDSSSVVDAAKAASQRVAAAKDAIREKVGQAGGQVTPEVPPTDPAPSAAPVETPGTPPPTLEPVNAPETAPPAPSQPMSLPATSQRPVVAESPQPPAPETAAATTSAPQQQAPPADNGANAGRGDAAGSTETSLSPNAQQAVSNSMGAVEKVAAPEAGANPTTNETSAKPEAAPPQPPSAPEPATAPEPARPQPPATVSPAPTPTEASAPTQQVATPEPTASEGSASPEIVLKSAVTADQPAAASSVPATAGETPSAATSATPAAEPPKPAEAAAPAGATGFYDANAGANVVTNPRPGDPANGPAAVPAEPRRPSEAELAAAAAAKAAAEEAEASLRAPDPNLPRERVVETGAFAEPKEVGPDPATLAHKTTFQPGDSEGFEEGQRAGCTKNVTIAGLKGEKLVLGTPGWAERWIEKNEKRMLQICFSDTPMTTAKNYLIVFYTAPMNTNATQAVDPAAMPQGAPVGGVGAFTLSYGSTWHYAQDRNVGVTVLTHDEADEPQAELGKVWYATAYTEEGVPVSEHWPEKAKKPIHVDEKDTKSKKAREARAEMERVSDDLLDQMVGDIAKL